MKITTLFKPDIAYFKLVSHTRLLVDILSLHIFTNILHDVFTYKWLLSWTILMGAIFVIWAWIFQTKLRGKIDIVDPESTTQGTLYLLIYPYNISCHMLLTKNCWLNGEVSDAKWLALNTLFFPSRRQ